jgi:putative nucleotidyltransferase with HDIG domain
MKGQMPLNKDVKGPAQTSMGVDEYQARLELLYDVAQQANSASEVSSLLQEILMVTQRILNAAASSLLLINEKKGEFHLQAAGGDKADMLKQIDMDFDSGIIVWSANKNKSVIVNDVSKDKRFNKIVDETTGFVTKSVIAVPITRGQKVIGVIEIMNKLDGSDFSERDMEVLSGFASTEAVVLLVSMAGTAINNIKLCQSLQDDYKNTVETLATAADAKDPFASGHSRRVREYALMAAESLGLPEEDRLALEFGAMLHDIGKIGISENVLRKPGQLTSEEWYIMRKHALKGANIVSEIPYLQNARDIVLHHHERYDGSGYPEGLKGDKIPLGARLVAVADAFDTMTTDRSYRAALDTDQALSELVKNIGIQFCPVAVKAFISGFQKKKAESPGAGIDLTFLEEPAKASESDAEEQPENVPADTAGSKEEKIPEKKQVLVKGKRKLVSVTDSELFQGNVQLVIDSDADFEGVNQFKKLLTAIGNLKIILSGWSEKEGNTILISLTESMALGKVLREIPLVEQVYSFNHSVFVVLK